ncbi:MAG: hypothetical protein QNJ55_20465 [Xenococcus sp. MO_188.B8]|nr:hypothetical protein [Xenococcus sp. MO_188.B8]
MWIIKRDKNSSIYREDILACIAYGAEIAKDSYVEIPLPESRCEL